jgi:DNA-binding IclR family transcriptional regulator
VQTARLLGITPEICTRALATLAERGVLTTSEDGSYSLDFQRI